MSRFANPHAPDDMGVSDAIRQLKTGQTALYSSLKGDDMATKVKVMQAVTGSEPIRDHLDKVIKVQEIIVQPATMTDEDNGRATVQPRIILVDDEGKAFHAISPVLFRDVQSLVNIVGEPSTWVDAKGVRVPVSVKISRGGSGKRQFLTLTAV